MKIFTFLALALTLSSAANLSFADTPANPANNPANKPVAISPEQNILTINIQANPSTGYNWYLSQFNNQFFTLSSYQFTPGKTKMPGSPGTATFNFTINPSFHTGPYLSEIDFTYLRPWDMSSAVHQALWVLSIPGAPAQVLTPAVTPAATPATSSNNPAPAPTPTATPETSDTTNTTWLSIPAGA